MKQEWTKDGAVCEHVCLGCRLLHGVHASHRYSSHDADEADMG